MPAATTGTSRAGGSGSPRRTACCTLTQRRYAPTTRTTLAAMPSRASSGAPALDAERLDELAHRHAGGEQAERRAHPRQERALVGQGEPVVGLTPRGRVVAPPTCHAAPLVADASDRSRGRLAPWLSSGSWTRGATPRRAWRCSPAAASPSSASSARRSSDERFEAKQVTVTPTGDDGLTHPGGRRPGLRGQRSPRLRADHPQRLRCADRRHGELARRARRRLRRRQSARRTRIRVGDPDHDGERAAPLRADLHPARRPPVVRRAGARHHRHRRDARDRPLRGRRHRPGARRPAVQRRRPSGTSGGCTLGTRRRGLPRRHQPARTRRRRSRSAARSSGRTDPVAVPEPDLPARRGDDRVPLAVAMLPVGAAGVARHLPVGPPARPQRGVRRRGGRCRLRRTEPWLAAAPAGSQARPACASSPTSAWTSWPRPSSSRRRASSRGRARCCSASGSTTRRSARGSPGSPPAT